MDSLPAPGPRGALLALRADVIARLLASPIVARTEHFVMHRAADKALMPDLSTAQAPTGAGFVDNPVVQALPDAHSTPLIGLAMVVPKRHARRSVTRNLIRRQIREQLRQRAVTFAGREHLVRLRRGFDAARFPSAASTALRGAVRGELVALLDQVAPAKRPG